MDSNLNRNSNTDSNLRSNLKSELTSKLNTIFSSSENGTSCVEMNKNSRYNKIIELIKLDYLNNEERMKNLLKNQ